jgi:hypothetical protein
VFKHPGLIGVLVAVSGEVYFDWKEEVGKKGRWKKFFMALLVVSLAYELYEASETDEEAANAIELAGKANERASTNELRVAELQSNNLVLATQLEKLKHPRIITVEQREKFIEILSEAHNFSKTRIEVIIGNNDRETERFAFQIRKLLDEAGYGDGPSKYQQFPLAQMVDKSIYVTNALPHIDLPAFEWKDAKLAKIVNFRVSPLLVSDIGRFAIRSNGVSMISTENPFTDTVPEVIALFSESIPAPGILPSVNIAYPTENNTDRSVMYVYTPTKDPNAILNGVCVALHDGGATIGINTTAGIMAPGHVAFFIPSQ